MAECENCRALQQQLAEKTAECEHADLFVRDLARQLRESRLQPTPAAPPHCDHRIEIGQLDAIAEAELGGWGGNAVARCVAAILSALKAVQLAPTPAAPAPAVKVAEDLLEDFCQFADLDPGPARKVMVEKILAAFQKANPAAPAGADGERLDLLDEWLRSDHADVSRNGAGQLCIRRNRNDGQPPAEYGDLRFAIDRFAARAKEPRP